MYHFVNESLIFIYFFALFIGALDTDLAKTDAYSKTCINLIMTAWIMNIGLSLILSVASIFSKIYNYIKKRKATEVRDEPYRIKTAPGNENVQNKTIDLEGNN